MQGVHGPVPQVHEAEQAAIDRLPAPLQGVPRLPHGQVRFRTTLAQSQSFSRALTVRTITTTED
mgnify:CR=1 FL=1|jgi:hypothetical protein